MELSVLCRGLHGTFVLLHSAPICPGPCAVAWNTCTRHFCCSVALLLLSVLVQAVLSTFPAPRPVAAREYLHGEALWKVLCVFLRALSVGVLRSLSTWFRRVLTSPSLHCDFFRHLSTRRPRRESVLRTSLSHLPSASRAWHRVSVTFELLGLCCCPDVMSSSSGILSFAPSMANSTLNSAQFVCLLRCHHGSCFFLNCLFEQLDTVSVSARARDDVVSLAKIMTPTSLKSASFFIRSTLRQ